MRHDGFIFRVRVVGLVLTAAYLAFIAWMLLRPHYVTWVPAPNLRPFGTIREDLAMGAREAAQRIAEGLALLAPLGVLLPMAGGRIHVSAFTSFARTVFAAMMVSLSVEFLQTMVPGQLFDVDALLLNTAGAALAHLLVVPSVRRALRRREAVAGPGGLSQGPTPTSARVRIAP